MTSSQCEAQGYRGCNFFCVTALFKYNQLVGLLLMVLFENVHVFNSRSETVSIFKQNFFGNPLLLLGMLAAQGIHIAAMHMPGISSVLMLEPFTLALWTQLFSIALCLIIVDELHKKWHKI